MKPVVDMKKCGASQSSCKAIKACPVEAISYIESKEPILDKDISCSCTPSTETNSCDCGDDCGGSPYGRIVIDYDKCTGCGLCVDECCGNAIDLVNNS